MFLQAKIQKSEIENVDLGTKKKQKTKYWNEKYWTVKVLDIEVCYGI